MIYCKFYTTIFSTVFINLMVSSFSQHHLKTYGTCTM